MHVTNVKARLSLIAAAALLAGLGAVPSPRSASAGSDVGSDLTIVAAGDIACPGEPCAGQRATARLIGQLDPTAVLTLGDNQYSYGELSDFKASYGPTWGKFLDETFPTPGNHDYGTPSARGYFRYFGNRAHRSTGGSYSFELGDWHLLALNSGPGEIPDAKLRWVRRDLRADTHTCELAYWHHPRWSSGKEHGSDAMFGPLWEVLYRAGVDVVLNGHEHNYERFAPLDPTGNWDPKRGIREFVVGTGGRSHYSFGDPLAGSQERIDSTFGLLQVVLRPSSYAWRFIGTGGATLDSGSRRCHR